jgi:2-iminobutanoate/2-iminopropanoate deaminase
MSHTIESANAPKAIGPYSQAVVHHGVAYLSGQIPLDPATGQVVEGDVAVQTARVLDNLGAVLEACGSRFGRVIKTTVYLADMNDFPRVNEVYARYFTENFPARSTVQVARLPKDVKVEIDAIALT